MDPQPHVWKKPAHHPASEDDELAYWWQRQHRGVFLVETGSNGGREKLIRAFCESDWFTSQQEGDTEPKTGK